MKKLIISLLMLVGVVAACQARDEYSRDAGVLPQAARTVIGKNFKSKVGIVKIDKDFGRVSEYEVTLDDGTEITFDRNGNWKDVECNSRRSVPDGFILPAIRKYVAKNYKNVKIVGVEKERNGYEISLSNGIDMKFDKQGVCQKFD